MGLGRGTWDVVAVQDERAGENNQRTIPETTSEEHCLLGLRVRRLSEREAWLVPQTHVKL